jgi:hypothetical protein
MVGKRKKSHGLPNTVKVSLWSGKGHDVERLLKRNDRGENIGLKGQQQMCMCEYTVRE